MHPFERLRYVARANGASPIQLTVAAARALAGLGDDHAGLVTGCRQMVDRHPEIGPLWWTSARLLVADDPEREAWRIGESIEHDPTPEVLAAELPQDATIVVLGWPELAAPALHRRADVEVRVIDTFGEGHQLVASLERMGVDAVEVAESGLGSAVADAGGEQPALVVLEALALGPDGLVGAPGSRAAASVAQHEDVTVWVAAGIGRALPRPLWQALLARMSALGEPWDLDAEFVPAKLVDLVVGPWGTGSIQDAVDHADCPVAPELFKGVFAPGTR